MDQKQIGKFISDCRKEKGLTQAEFAEKFGITDRAVSKWETGKTLPDYSIIREVCETLGVTMNELLSGEKIKKEDALVKAEENLEKMAGIIIEKDKLMISAYKWFCAFGLILYIALICCGIYIESIVKHPWLGKAIIGFAIILVIIMAFAGIYIESKAGYYQCSDCGHKHKVSYWKVFFAPHIGLARRLTCPNCGKKNYHKKVTD